MSKTPPPLQPFMDAVMAFSAADNWAFEEIEGQNIIRMRFSGENANWTCYAQVKEDQERYVFYSTLETRGPEEKWHAIAEYITRMNFGLFIGNFDMDYSDGEVRFMTSVDIEDSSLTQKSTRNLVYMNALMMDKYLPRIMRVSYSNTTPADAIAQIEIDKYGYKAITGYP
jgi:hypothetical protein